MQQFRALRSHDREPSEVGEPFPARAWRWLRTGETSTGSSRSWAIFGSTRPRSAWRMHLAAPYRVITLLRGRSSVRLVPLHYLVVGAIGAVIGAVIAAVRRAARPRSLTVPLGAGVGAAIALAAAWLAALVSPVWLPHGRLRRFGRSRGRRFGPRLRTDLLAAIFPERAGALHHADEAERLRASTLPLVEIAAWKGARSIAGWSEGPDGIGSLALAFGRADSQPDRDDTRAVVRILGGEDARRERAQRSAIDELIGLRDRIRSATLEAPGDSPGGHAARPADLAEVRASAERAFAAQRALAERLGTIGWTDTTLVVDGRPHPASRLRFERVTAWCLALGDAWVVVCAADDDGPITLRRAPSIEPYLEGRPSAPRPAALRTALRTSRRCRRPRRSCGSRTRGARGR